MNDFVNQGCDTRTALTRVLKKYRKAAKAAGMDLLHRQAPESLHDVRVVTRRARSILKQSEGIVREKYRRRLSKCLREFGDRTNLARDIEVFLADLPRYQQQLPEQSQVFLQQLEQSLQQQLQQEEDSIRQQIIGKKFRRMLKIWKDCLRGKLFKQQNVTSGKDSIGDWSRIKTSELLHAMVDDSTHLACSGSDKDLHAFRIDAKKLRYWVTEFEFLLSEQDRQLFLSHLEKIQQELGRFQDISSQLRQLPIRSQAESLQAAQPLIELLQQLHVQQGARCKPLISEFIALPQIQRLMAEDV